MDLFLKGIFSAVGWQQYFFLTAPGKKMIAYSSHFADAYKISL